MGNKSGNQNLYAGHPGFLELATVAEMLVTGRKVPGAHIQEVLHHLSVCPGCREEVMDLADLLQGVNEVKGTGGSCRP